MEAASFVGKEPSKVAVRFIGLILHYKINHLLPTDEFTVVHQKLNIFVKILHTAAYSSNCFRPYTTTDAECVQ